MRPSSPAQEWSSAFDLWLASHPSPNTRRAYRKAWDLFFAFTSRSPWEISKSDVARWIEYQRAQHLSPETIQQRLAALSSFYTYVTRIYTSLTPDGREQPLHFFNPVKAVPRPRTSPYNKARYLNVDQARAFLHAIPRYTLQGMRDYALFLTYLATGRRNSEIRSLRYGDIESCPERSEGSLPSLKPGTGVRSNGRIWFRWNGKGRQRRDELPQSVWTAILDFLKSSDRLDSISPSDHIFTALNDSARYLPNVQKAALSSLEFGETKLPSKHQPASDVCPISAQMVCRLLKKYIRLAGLNPQGITVHTLRHTAAMLRKEAGDDLQSISSFLAHSSLTVTQIYLHQVEGRQDTTWLKVEALLGIS
jgi:site-specific recombinase XerD